MSIDLTTSLCGVKLKNPTVLASGFWGVSGESLVRVAKAGAGAVTSKSCNLQGRHGHKNPTVLEWNNSMLNAVGLSNPGAVNEVEELKLAVRESPSPVIASLFGASAQEFAKVAEKLVEAKPALLELDASCPNVGSEGQFAHSCEQASSLVKAVKDVCGSVPVSIKLAPNVPNLVEIAKAVEKAGADAITAINTMPAMYIEPEVGKPFLYNKTGGLSGTAIKPIAVYCVYNICKNVEIPVIGTGGVSSGRDLVEMVMAGATAVGIGTAVTTRGEGVFKQVCVEASEFLKQRGFKSLKEVRGMAFLE